MEEFLPGLELGPKVLSELWAFCCERRKCEYNLEGILRGRVETTSAGLLIRATECVRGKESRGSLTASSRLYVKLAPRQPQPASALQIRKEELRALCDDLKVAVSRFRTVKPTSAEAEEIAACCQGGKRPVVLHKVIDNSALDFVGMGYVLACDQAKSRLFCKILAIVPDVSVYLYPIKALPVASNAVLSRLQTTTISSKRPRTKEFETGFLSLDQEKHLVALHASDPAAKVSPLAGVWVSGLGTLCDGAISAEDNARLRAELAARGKTLHNQMVLGAILRFLLSDDIKTRVTARRKSGAETVSYILMNVAGTTLQFMEFQPKSDSWTLLESPQDVNVAETNTLRVRLAGMAGKKGASCGAYKLANIISFFGDERVPRFPADKTDNKENAEPNQKGSATARSRNPSLKEPPNTEAACALMSARGPGEGIPLSTHVYRPTKNVAAAVRCHPAPKARKDRAESETKAMGGFVRQVPPDPEDARPEDVHVIKTASIPTEDCDGTEEGVISGVPYVSKLLNQILPSEAGFARRNDLRDIRSLNNSINLSAAKDPMGPIPQTAKCSIIESNSGSGLMPTPTVCLSTGGSGSSFVCSPRGSASSPMMREIIMAQQRQIQEMQKQLIFITEELKSVRQSGNPAPRTGSSSCAPVSRKLNGLSLSTDLRKECQAKISAEKPRVISGTVDMRPQQKAKRPEAVRLRSCKLSVDVGNRGPDSEVDIERVFATISPEYKAKQAARSAAVSANTASTSTDCRQTLTDTRKAAESQERGEVTVTDFTVRMGPKQSAGQAHQPMVDCGNSNPFEAVEAPPQLTLPEAQNGLSAIKETNESMNSPDEAAVNMKAKEKEKEKEKQQQHAMTMRQKTNVSASNLNW